MFLIIFNTRYALLLSWLRFLRPRNNRGMGAEDPRNLIDFWPQTRPILGHKPPTIQTRTRLFHVRGQSTVTISPRTRAWPRPLHGRSPSLGFATGENYPLTGHETDLSASIFPPQAENVHELRQSDKCPAGDFGISARFANSDLSSSYPIPSYVYI